MEDVPLITAVASPRSKRPAMYPPDTTSTTSLLPRKNPYESNQPSRESSRPSSPAVPSLALPVNPPGSSLSAVHIGIQERDGGVRLAVGPIGQEPQSPADGMSQYGTLPPPYGDVNSFTINPASAHLYHRAIVESVHLG